MAIKMGGFSGSGEKERNEQQTEIVQDKYTGEQFEIERHSDFITILPNIINDIGCHHIIEQFISLPFTDCHYENSEVTAPDEIIEQGLSCKCEADHNKDHATIASDSKEFHAIMEVMGHLIPDHPDFRRITYIQIVHYKEDSFFPFHRDVAEDTDFGTCIMQLNDDFKGGQLNVQGNLIAKNQGTITFFNNSTKVWHGVEPIYEGQRFVLLIWFGREENDSEMQPVSERVESGDSEVSLTDSE